jgi:ankyrin repeat protein
MSEITLESQLFEIIKNKELSEDIKLAKFDMLIKLGVDVNAMYGARSALRIAKDKKLTEVSKYLEENGAKNIFDEKKAKELGENLIKECNSRNVNLEKVKELVEHGADVNDKYEEGWTALMKASINGYKEIAEFLIENGAKVNQKNKWGKGALMKASEYGHKEVAEVLVEWGADVNDKNNFNKTPLMGGAYYGHKEVVEFLVAKGGDVNLKDIEGNTALMEACKNGHKEVIKLLIEKGADVSCKNKDGQSAIELAKDEEIKRILIEASEKKSFLGKIKKGFGIGE